MHEEYRPLTFEEYRGQAKLKKRLKIHIDAAKRNGTLIDHVFLAATPGAGKTTLAQVIAFELGTTFVKYVMPLKENTLRSIIIRYSGVVLLDEIHRATKAQQESLLTVIEDGYLQPASGARIEIKNPITFVGATTEPQDVIKPLKERFKIKPFFDPYSDQEMADIVKGMASKSGVDMSSKMALKLGQACAGIPRHASELVAMTRDLQSNNWRQVLEACELSEDGLTREHKEYLKYLALHNGIAGLAPLADMLRMDKSTVVGLETLLFNKGFITYSKSGRELTAEGYSRADLPSFTP